MKQIVFTIASKDYTISLEDDFAKTFDDDIEKLLHGRYKFGVKDILTAFVQKCHEAYMQDLQTNEILDDVNKILK